MHDLTQHVARLRRFNRFYTRQIGVLHEGLLGGALSLTQSRIVYELAQAETTATRLGAELELDPGYLSRLIRDLEAAGLIVRRRSDRDARQSLLTLTAEGKAAFAVMDARSAGEIAGMLEQLSPQDRQALVASLATAERLLGGASATPVPSYILRPPRPGDMGWVVHRQAILYSTEYGWDTTFEALVAEIVARFIQTFDPVWERCWIADREGSPVGSAFIVHDSDEVAKLRLLYVEQSTRGLGIGQRLVEECIRFAREAGYRRLTLWTNSILVAARHIYQRAGFALVAEAPHHSFGHDLIGQNWELEL